MCSLSFITENVSGKTETGFTVAKSSVFSLDFHVTYFSAEAHSCLHTQFRCANNVCIPKWQFCDGVDQCGDGSDELTCAVTTNGCNATQFKCTNRKCIANAFVCDRKDDCGDASDEKYCGRCNSNVCLYCVTICYVTVSAWTCHAELTAETQTK